MQAMTPNASVELPLAERRLSNDINTGVRVGVMRNWQEGRNLGFEQPDEFCVHVFVFVWYVEADDSLVCEVLPELGSDFVLGVPAP